jgi:hypothetical protein
METIHDILMKTAENELAVLIDYYDAVLEGFSYKARLVDLNKEDKVSQIILTIEKCAKDFFIVMMEYEDIVLNIAKTMMDITINDDDQTDIIELKIAGRFITDNFANIPKQQKRELLDILGYNHDNLAIDLKDSIECIILASAQTASTAYTITAWLTKATMQSFVQNKGAAWESNSLINRIIQKIWDNVFRKRVILPLLYIIMLRWQYRYQNS